MQMIKIEKRKFDKRNYHSSPVLCLNPHQKACTNRQYNTNMHVSHHGLFFLIPKFVYNDNAMKHMIDWYCLTNIYN